MKFLIFDREENYIGNLKDVLEAKQTEEINGEDVLELAVLEQKFENISDEWGRNLLRNSGGERERSGETVQYPFTEEDLKDVDVGGTITYSFWARLKNDDTYGDSIDAYFRTSSAIILSTNMPTQKVTKEWKLFKYTFVLDEQAKYETVTFRVRCNQYVGNNTQAIDILVRNVKIEKGPIATPWTPAPEDVDIKPQDTIEKGYKLVYKDKYGYWKEFIVKEIEESHTSDGIEKRLFCESSFYETFGDYIEDKRPSGTASHALSVALEPTRWEVGTVDNLGTNATNFYQISAKEAVQKVAVTWKGEIRTRVEVVGNKIVHRYVDILERRGGDFGQRFTYSKNLESVTKITHSNDVITALYGYGKGEEVGDGHGRRIDFAELNDGKAYVENLEALAIWGRPNGDGTKSHVFDKVYFDNCEDKQELLQLTTEKLEEISSPLITYEAKAIDLGGADLGDDVAVIDTEFTPELRLKARVIKIVRDLLKEENNNLVLGNFIPSIVDNWNKQEEFISNFRSKAGVWDRAKIIDSDGTINAQFLNNLVDELNKKMNSQGGYVYVSEDGKGLITYDKPIDQDPTMAIQLLGGAFRIANSKLPNGELNWRTYGTGDGFTADEIIAGILRGGKVHFDLTNGTFLIGDSPEDYIFYFDGATLKVRLGTGKTVEESLQDIQDYADTKASQAESAAKAYAELKAQEEVENLEIGGRNLSPNSENLMGHWSGYQGASITYSKVDVTDEWGFSEGYRLQISGGTHNIKGIYSTSGKITEPMAFNQNYTYSLYIKNMSDKPVIMNMNGLQGAGNPVLPVGYSGRFIATGQRRELYDWFQCNLRTENVEDEVDVIVGREKIEKGSKATDWTPAPEDVDEAIQAVDTKYSNKVAEINTTIDGITQRVSSTESNITTIGGTVSSLSTRMDTAEQKITPTAIVQTVRQSTAYQGDLNGKVDSNEIISSINQTAEQIKIQANKIKLEGLVTANSNFKVLTDGSIEAKNATISGIVTAISGSIGDWSINNSIYSKHGDTYTTLKGSGQVAFAAGAPDPNSTGGSNLQIFHDGRILKNSDGTRRILIDNDRINFYDPTGAFGGRIFADTSHDYWSTIFTIQPSPTGYLNLHTGELQSGYAAVQVIPASGDSDIWYDNRVRLVTMGSGGYAHVELEDGWVDINAPAGLWVSGTIYLDDGMGDPPTIRALDSSYGSGRQGLLIRADTAGNSASINLYGENDGSYPGAMILRSGGQATLYLYPDGNARFYGNLRVDGAITNASINANQLTGTVASARLPIRAGSFTIVAGSSTNVSFSSSLPSTVRVVANVGGSSSTDYGTLKVYNVSTSGFSAILTGGTTQTTVTCYYIAVGGF